MAELDRELDDAFKVGDVLHYNDYADGRKKILVAYISDHPKIQNAARVLFIKEGKTLSVNKFALERIEKETAEEAAWKVWGER
jgi:hypothetical protein|tara:strand:+ start:49 stop:297 length:249 start_codon:yes stop_codon:yes gene_type:complete